MVFGVQLSVMICTVELSLTVSVAAVKVAITFTVLKTQIEIIGSPRVKKRFVHFTTPYLCTRSRNATLRSVTDQSSLLHHAISCHIII